MHPHPDGQPHTRSFTNADADADARAAPHESQSNPSHASPGDAVPVTANDLLKLRARSWYSRSIVLAVLIHVAVLTLTPEFSVADTRAERAPEMLVVPKPVELPPAPEPIARPAAPVVGTLDLDPDVTMVSTRIDAWDPQTIAPPARTERTEGDAFRVYAPSMVAPELLNAAEVERELVRRYPAGQRAAGIGGQVDVQLWLDEGGNVVRSAVGRSSGHEALDAAALKVVEVMRLSPALSRGMPVRVIVTVPVLFRVR